MENIKFLALTAAISLSAPALADDFVITTGGEGGGYERMGRLIAANIKKQASKSKVELDISVINSNGSIENIERLNSGDAHAAIVQADALNVMKPSIPFKAKKAHTETVFWIYNIKNDFSDLEDVEGNEDVVIVLVDGSGAVVTMQSFVQEDGGYKVNYDSAVYADDLYDAFDIVSEGTIDGVKVAGLLYVSNQIPSEVAMDFKGSVAVGELTDSDFNDAEDVNGESLYENCEVDKAKTNGLASGWGDIDTVCLSAMVVYTTDLEDRKTEKAVKKGIIKALRGVK